MQLLAASVGKTVYRYDKRKCGKIRQNLLLWGFVYFAGFGIKKVGRKCRTTLPSYMEFYTGQREKAIDFPAKQAENVAFTNAMVHLQFHKISNVHLQFQCCSKDFN